MRGECAKIEARAVKRIDEAGGIANDHPSIAAIFSEKYGSIE